MNFDIVKLKIKDKKALLALLPITDKLRIYLHPIEVYSQVIYKLSIINDESDFHHIENLSGIISSIDIINFDKNNRLAKLGDTIEMNGISYCYTYPYDGNTQSFYIVREIKIVPQK